MDECRPRTLVELLERSAEEFGTRKAVSMKAGLRTRSLNYAELAAAMVAVAGDLATRQDLARGDRVMILAPNGIDTVAALFGLWRAGLVAVPLDVNSTPVFVQAVGRQTEARLIIGPPSLAEGLGFDVMDPGRIFSGGTTAPPQHRTRFMWAARAFSRSER